MLHATALENMKCQDKTWTEIDRKYYGITKKEVAFLLEYCAICAKTLSAKTAAPLEAIIVNELWERLQIDLIDFWHLSQKSKWLHVDEDVLEEEEVTGEEEEEEEGNEEEIRKMSRFQTMIWSTV
ncbi:hypothetical protein BDD12DRAFT_900640 [Trichophaea hybrida]|nr:hypothetical protein BDD12DRAFT_900640 [Trichophaea hybrida]